jgi:glycosyltransferase involved in cell wall biosynthesis
MGAEVDFFSWCSDFSAARNYAISLAKTPWRLILDADEWLNSDRSAVRRVCAAEANFVGRIEIISSFTNQAHGGNETLYARTRVSRLLPHGAAYRGTIHEQVVYPGPVRNVDIAAAHDGYENQQLNNKKDRDLLMLDSAIAAGEADPYIHYQYAKELARRSANTRAANLLIAVLDNPNTGRTPWHESAVCLALSVFPKAGFITHGARLIEREIQRYSNSADFFYSAGFFYLHAATCGTAADIQLLSLAENSFLKCLEIGESGEKPHSMLGSGSFLPAKALASFYAAYGDSDRACKYRLIAETIK